MSTSAIMPPKSAGSTTKKAARKGKGKGRKAKRSAPVSARLGKVKSDLASLGVFWGQVAGSAALASTAKGYFGDKMDIMGKVDGRLAAGAAGVLLKLSGKAGQWDQVVTNVTTGVLTSWLAEKGFEYGQNKAMGGAAPAPAVEAETKGIVIGNVNEVGLFGSAEKRLEKKLTKLKAKASKKGIEWSDIQNEGEDDEPRGGGARIVRRGPVVIAPRRRVAPRPWFRVAPRRRAVAVRR